MTDCCQKSFFLHSQHPRGVGNVLHTENLPRDQAHNPKGRIPDDQFDQPHDDLVEDKEKVGHDLALGTHRAQNDPEADTECDQSEDVHPVFRFLMTNVSGSESMDNERKVRLLWRHRTCTAGIIKTFDWR